MDKKEYFELCDTLTHFTPLPRERYNEVFRMRLLACGLTLTTVYPNDKPWIVAAPVPTAQDDGQTPHTPETDPFAWRVPSWIVPIDHGPPPVASVEKELRDTLYLFREFYNFYVTQTKLGASHHHPIWARVAVLLGDMNTRKPTTEEYHFLTAPFWETQTNAKN